MSMRFRRDVRRLFGIFWCTYFLVLVAVATMWIWPVHAQSMDQRLQRFEKHAADVALELDKLSDMDRRVGVLEFWRTSTVDPEREKGEVRLARIETAESISGTLLKVFVLPMLYFILREGLIYIKKSTAVSK